jgi:hypothetical protein
MIKLATKLFIQKKVIDNTDHTDNDDTKRITKQVSELIDQKLVNMFITTLKNIHK